MSVSAELIVLGRHGYQFGLQYGGTRATSWSIAKGSTYFLISLPCFETV